MITPQLFNIDEFLASRADEHAFMAVLGRPISHSLSPLIHNYALKSIGNNSVYYPINVPEGQDDKLREFFRHKNFRGANVTIPLKQLVSKHVDHCSEVVIATGAANTVYRLSEGLIKADNTDIDGFLAPLLPSKTFLYGKSALVFGSGGAAKAVVFALKSIGVKSIFIVSRNPEALIEKDFEAISYSKWNTVVEECALVVNTSPIGMYPNVDYSPVSTEFSHLLSGKICYDLIYRPFETRFLKQSRQNGAKTIINGLEMFIGQAAQSFRLFTSHEFPTSEVRSLLQSYFETEVKESTS